MVRTSSNVPGEAHLRVEATRGVLSSFKRGIIRLACCPDTFPCASARLPCLMIFRKVKNSWGNTWGMNGYILLERSDSEEKQGGECGLLIEAVYPILESEPAYDFWFDPASVIQRPEGFESSASAKDCGGGTTDVIFSDGKPRFSDDIHAVGLCLMMIYSM